MAYAGCAVNRRRGRIVVCATGEATELGQIERLAAGAFFAGRPFGGDVDRRLRSRRWRSRSSCSCSRCARSGSRPWRLPPNPWLLWSAIGSAALEAAAVYVPALQGPLATNALGPAEATVTLVLALVPFAVLEAPGVSDRAAPAATATSRLADCPAKVLRYQ